MSIMSDSGHPQWCDPGLCCRLFGDDGDDLMHYSAPVTVDTPDFRWEFQICRSDELKFDSQGIESIDITVHPMSHDAEVIGSLWVDVSDLPKFITRLAGIYAQMDNSMVLRRNGGFFG